MTPSELPDEVTVKVKERVATPILVLLCISVALNTLGLLGIGFLSLRTNHVAQSTNMIVQDIERKNSADALTIDRQRLEDLVAQIECNERRVAQEVVEILESVGVLPDSEVEVGNCPDN